MEISRTNAGAFVLVTASSILGLQLLPTRDATAASGKPAAITQLSMAAAAQSAAPAAVPSNPDRNAYFGQTHNHTSWSPDAYVIGNTITGPAEAYQFAMGQSILHPGWLSSETPASARFPGRDRPLRICRHDAAGERPELPG